MTDLLNAIRKFIETVAPALAVMIWDYEENKADHAIKEKEATQLALKNQQDENTIRANFAGKSDDAIISEILGTTEHGSSTPGVSEKPKSGSNS